MSAIDFRFDKGWIVATMTPFPPPVRLAGLLHSELPAAGYSGKRKRWEMATTTGSLWRLNKALASLTNLGDAAISVSNELRAEIEQRVAPLLEPMPSSDAELPFESPTQPWRHQRMAFWFLRWARRNLGCALLDCGMRTGKTRMVLDHFRGLKRQFRRGLIFCPKVVVPVWAEQAERHCLAGELNVVSIEKGLVEKRVAQAVELLRGEEPVIVVLGWSVLERLDLAQKKALRDSLSQSTLVADEVHFAKGAGSGRSMALSYIGRGARMRIGASGTPLAHSPLDAYGVFRFLDWGLWGTSVGRFNDRYARMGGFNGRQVVGYNNLEELAARMRPYTFRATREVLDLPPSTDSDVVVTMPPSAIKIYRDVQNEAIAELKSGTLIVANGLSKLIRLAQVASGYLPTPDVSAKHIEALHHEKQAALKELLESSAPDEPWVVFGRFHYDLDSAIAAADKAGRPHFELSGRRHELADWKRSCADGRGPVLVSQLQAGGIGVDMTEASLCAYMSVGYSLSEYEQSRARVHGPDQKRPVAYYHIIARGTVDRQIRRALAKRADVLAYVASELVAGRIES